jgi:hypothetical protein
MLHRSLENLRVELQGDPMRISICWEYAIDIYIYIRTVPKAYDAEWKRK